MPNWCEGNIRIRGTKDGIKSFLKNELLLGANTERKVSAVVEEHFCDLSVSHGKDHEPLYYDCFYIDGTKRNFIKGACFEVFAGDESGEVATACIDGFRAAWDIDPEPYIEKAKRHGVDIKIFGIEQGMQFVRTVEIIHGELSKNETQTFDDWDWDCPFPRMGG